MDKVLIVDDDPAICRLLEKVMHSNDLAPVTVTSGRQALAQIEANQGADAFALILLDVMLGDMEGFEVIQNLRSRRITTPVIIISGRSEDYDMLYGLSLGADDYVTKPFRPHVLGAKAKALIRRSRSFLQENSDTLVCEPFTYEIATMRFYKDGEELNLSTKERTLLLMFIQHPQQVFTKDMIYEQVWGDATAVDDNAIMVYVNRLRSKIEENVKVPRHIITIRGLGYRFVP